MSGFGRDERGAALLAGMPLAALLAEAGAGTPAYVYDVGAMRAQARALEEAFGTAPHVVAYAVKANSAGSILRAFAEQGSGADVVSGAELELALGCGITPEKIVMSGVAKTDAEIDLAMQRGIRAIQAESLEELDRIAARARANGRQARVSLRINPGVEIDSHAHVATGHDAAKFGIRRADVAAAWQRIDREPELVAVGVSTHVGSMLHVVEPYLEAARAACEVAKARLEAGGSLQFVDFGGGMGIDYGELSARPAAEFARAGLELLREQGLSHLTLVVEPGRALVGAFGVLVARVIQGKKAGGRRWAMIDAGMNDLLRPALYGTRHRIEPIDRAPGGASYRVVGPVCESADDFGEHELGDPLPGHVVIRDAGAYGFAMANAYNGRALPVEVFAEDGRVASVSPSPGTDAWLKSRREA